MLVKINRRMVDVADRECAARSCFSLGFDKGSYSPGRGYASYHTDARGRHIEKPVCMTRHLRGCPTNSVCGKCRLCSVRDVGQPCASFGCGGVTVEREPPK